ncbi:MAG: CoA transferase, partial [Bryobacteraceae bacterium]
FVLGQRNAGNWPGPAGHNLLDTGAPFYEVYTCADGREIAVGALEPKFWSALCRRLDRADLESGQFAADPRRSGIIAELERIFRTRPAREWVEHFAGVDACVTAALDLAEVAADEHLRRRGTLVESDGRVSIGPLPVLSETPGRIGGPPPRLGQHTMEGE